MLHLETTEAVTILYLESYFKRNSNIMNRVKCFQIFALGIHLPSESVTYRLQHFVGFYTIYQRSKQFALILFSDIYNYP